MPTDGVARMRGPRDVEKERAPPIRANGGADVWGESPRRLGIRAIAPWPKDPYGGTGGFTKGSGPSSRGMSSLSGGVAAKRRSIRGSGLVEKLRGVGPTSSLGVAAKGRSIRGSGLGELPRRAGPTSSLDAEAPKRAATAASR